MKLINQIKNFKTPYMVVKIKKHYFFYRDYLMGSAIIIGTIIGSGGNIFLNILSIIMTTYSLWLIIKGTILNYTVNVFPDEFVRERYIIEQNINQRKS